MRTAKDSRRLPKIRVAAVQSASPFLSLRRSTEKACQLIGVVGESGADVIVFPEGFIPGHPAWFHFHADTSTTATDLSLRLFQNAIDVPSDETQAIGRAARKARAYVVIGVCEREPGSDGTMYNSQLIFAPNGDLLGKHRKLMPTLGERLVHAVGYGDTFGAVPASFGPLSTLICGENMNPLAVFALAAEHTRVHSMSWPPYINDKAGPLGDLVLLVSRSFALAARCFVVSSCALIDDELVKATCPDGTAAFFEDASNFGGSVIVSPSGQVLAGPMGSEEGFIVADIDLAEIERAKLHLDFAGHYNRPDVFQLRVNRTGPRLYTSIDDDPRAVATE